jgi:hypothetical protein
MSDLYETNIKKKCISLQKLRVVLRVERFTKLAHSQINGGLENKRKATGCLKLKGRENAAAHAQCIFVLRMYACVFTSLSTLRIIRKGIV